MVIASVHKKLIQVFPGVTLMRDDLSLVEMRLATQPKKSAPEKISAHQMRRLSLWSELNIPFEEDLFNGNKESPPTVYVKGSNQILLVSVHGVSHFSGVNVDDYKIADLNTGGLVRLIQSELHTSSVINYKRSLSNNPWLGRTDSNRVVTEFLTLNSNGVVLDIHGCKDNNDFDLALGTCINHPNESQKNVISLLFRLSRSYEIRVALNPPHYQARTKLGITGRAIVEFPNSPVLQLEIARSFRCPQEKNLKSALLADFLYCAIDKIRNV